MLVLLCFVFCYCFVFFFVYCCWGNVRMCWFLGGCGFCGVVCGELVGSVVLCVFSYGFVMYC